MDRRAFLKFVAAAVAAGLAPALPVDVGAESPEVERFDASREYGMAMRWWGTGDQQELVTRYLHESARQYLPRGTVYELRRFVPEDYGMEHGMAWYSSPRLTADKPRVKHGEYDNLGGYFFYGRFAA